jgi:hypothetical protein
MRPRYESAKDREAESKFAAQMLDETGEEYIKLPDAFIVDFAIKAGEEYTGFAEFKRRYVRAAQYPTLILAFHKWDALVEYSLWSKARLWVQYDDCLKFVDVSEDLKPEVKRAGRRDRDDRADIEACVHIPFSWLRKYETER